MKPAVSREIKSIAAEAGAISWELVREGIMTAFRATVLTLSGHGHRKIERKASALVALFDQKGCFQNLADVEAVGTHTSVDTCAVAFDRY